MLHQFFVVVGRPKEYSIVDSYATAEKAVERCPAGGFVVEVRSNLRRPAGTMGAV